VTNRRRRDVAKALVQVRNEASELARAAPAVALIWGAVVKSAALSVPAVAWCRLWFGARVAAGAPRALQADMRGLVTS
jgi:hypothetical protein